MTTLTASEFRALKPAKRNKYGAKAVTVDGIRFASKREAAFYGELKQREKAGEVYEVELQPRFSFVHNGVLIGTYKPDFMFWDAVAHRNRVIDVKGVETREFRTNLRLMRAFHKIQVEVVR
jgi:hypothetical protein